MRGFHRDERGFTLQELLVVISIVGILFAIAIMVWNNILEARRVDSAANQLAADFRLAHNRATSQLTDWRVVVVPNRGNEEQGADYYLMKLQEPYPASSPPNATEKTPRTFPGNVKASQPNYQDNQGDPFFVSPESSAPSSTLTFEFNSDGSMRAYGGVSGSACVTVDGNPEMRDYVLAATSRVEVRDASC